MGFAADITGTLAGLIPAQQALVSSLAAPVRPARDKIVKRGELQNNALTPAGELLSMALIRDAVQECLQDSLQDTAGTLHALMADDEIVELLHELMGSPADGRTVGRSLQDVVDAFASLAAKDGQAADVVHAIQGFIEKLKTTTRQLAQLRLRADVQMTDSLTKANELLATIAAANRQIVLDGATGRGNNVLNHDQQRHLTELAKTLDFTCFRRQDGSIAVFTKKGVTLAAGDAVRLMRTENGVAADGIDIAEQLNGGAVPGYLHNRDVALPNVQSQLDTLAQTLQSRINQVSNRAIAGADARAFYHGSRLFADPAGHKISLSGGDAELSLLREDGALLTRISLSVAVKHYRRQAGLPAAGPWPIGQVTAAMAHWLAHYVPIGTPLTVWLTPEGGLSIDIPVQSGLRLAIRDQRSLALQSVAVATPDKALGLHGQLVLSDGLGNEFSTAPIRGGMSLSPADSLINLAGKIGRLDGLSCRLTTVAEGTALTITSQAGSDLTAEPDGTPNCPAMLLSLAPADDQAREDVAVNAITQSAANSVTSRSFAARTLALGFQGCLIVRDLTGAMLAFQTIPADWTLDRLSERLAAASDPRLTAGLIPTGNQIALKLSTTAPDDRFVIEGWPEGWQTSPRFGFQAIGGDLLVSVAGSPITRQTIAPGYGFEQIVDLLNAPDSPLAAIGLRAQMLHAGNAEILDIGHVGGLPLSFSGSAVGPAPGQLDFRYNLRDLLGLAPAADQVVPGFANFFGLNDLFIANPAGAFDSKAAIGVFTTTAAPGTADALTLSPALAEDPARLGTMATIRQISDMLNNSLNIAAAGDLPKGSFRLAQYADAIVNQVHKAATQNKTQLTYHRALLDQMARHKADEIDVSDRLSSLMALQQAYQDSTQVVAGLMRLSDNLRKSAH